MANMTEWGKTPFLTIKEFKHLGYNLVLFPMTLFRVMAKAVEEVLLELRNQGTQKEFIERMQSREQLYDVLRYDKYDQFERQMKERDR